jgi:hypothetical protein
LVEDRLFELMEGGTRLDAQLLYQQVPRLSVHVERLRLSPGAIEREHQLRAKPFTEGMLADESLEFGGELDVAPECEIGVDAVLQRAEPQLLETEDLTLGERLVRDVGERGAAPECERLTEELRGRLG